MFGIADRPTKLALVRPVARALIARDALRTDAYGGLCFGPGARPILKGEQELTIAVPPPRRRVAARQRYEGPADPLFEALREARRELAAEAAFRLMSSSTIRPCARSPRAGRAASASLATVQGVGAAKLERYGEAMLAAVAAAEETADDACQLDDKVLVSGQIPPGRRRRARTQGVTMIVNNRPDGEEPGQPLGAEIEEAAAAAGIDYRSVPIIRGIGPADVEAMREAISLKRARQGARLLPERHALGAGLGAGQERGRHGARGDRASG